MINSDPVSDNLKHFLSCLRRNTRVIINHLLTSTSRHSCQFGDFCGIDFWFLIRCLSLLDTCA
jgi:hypothetical protein